MTSMRSRPIKISRKKAEELLKLFGTIAEEPMSTHLSDDQFICYITGDLSEQEMHEIDLHLEMCEDCGSQIEQLAMNVMTWSGSNGTHRVNELRKQALIDLNDENVRGHSFLEELALQVRSLFLGANLGVGVVSAATEEQKQFQQGDQWSCFLDRDKRGNYTLRISSRDLSLEGTQLRLFSTNWQQEITLIRVDPNQIGAKVVLSPDDLAKIPHGYDFRVELIRQGPEQE